MKLMKKTVVLCLLALSSGVISARQTIEIPSWPSNSFLQSISATAVAPIITASAQAPTSNLNDITPTSKVNPAVYKNWLTNSQAQKIIAKAQQNGQLRYVMDRLESMQLPKSLALIPVIESHYTTKSKSNKGASGIWQLMPCTAKRFGISNNQRYQLAPSTNAALKYFKTLHQKFGSWELAIAAYNAGEGTVHKALTKNPHAINVQQLRLPTETKQYVQKFYVLESYLSQTQTTA